MLILTRRIDETIVIGDDIYITVLGIKGNQVRIGLDAPKTTSIHREEIYRLIQEESGFEYPGFIRSSNTRPLLSLKKKHVSHAVQTNH